MKPFAKHTAIMGELESTRAEITAAAQSVRAAATVGLVTFGLIAIVAVVALLSKNQGGKRN